MESSKVFTYVDKAKKTYSVTVKGELCDYSAQALKDYETSFKYIRSQEYHIWRNALKSYHMSTYDRKSQPNFKKWQHNISIGLVRSFIDVLIATVQEKPLTFIGTPINKKGLENKENILKVLNYVSDVTGFHRTIKKALANGLIFGEIALRISYLKTQKEQPVINIVNNNSIETVEVLSDYEDADFPNATTVSMFNIFPDPYSGRLRNVTERWVVDYREFMEIFGQLISTDTNKSPFRNEWFLKLLPLNKNAADHSDYGSIENEIHQKANNEAREKDKFNVTNTSQTNKDIYPTWMTADQDSDVTNWLIEFLYTSYDGIQVLHANGYPVYIGKNIFWFIPYVIKSATQSDARFWEGIPYLIKPLEDVANSFVNAKFDGARKLANPTFIAPKNLLINEHELENGTPWGVIWTETELSADSLRRLDKWGLDDFNILPLIMQIAQQITGISEYWLGQSAGERTASWALAVTQSSNKRMSPYMSTFVDAVSVVAVMWLKLIKKYWTKRRYIYILDDSGNQTFVEMSNKDLLGWINISLQAEGLFWSTNELELKKLIDTYMMLAPSWFFKSPDFAKEIIKKTWFLPSKFILDDTWHVKPDNHMELAAEWAQIQQPQSEWQMLAEAANFQTDFGNQWKWQ